MPKGIVNNPKGNPNIGQLSKIHSTGPRTQAGKISGAVKKLKSGKYSKIIKQYRKACNSCPLGARIKETIRNGKIDKVIFPAVCPYFRKNSRTCKMPIQTMSNQVKALDEVIHSDTIEMQKQLIMQSVLDAQLNREHETLEKGKPAFYTKEFQEQALKYTGELNKIIHGEKQRIDANINQKIATIDINDYIREELDKEEKDD